MAVKFCKASQKAQQVHNGEVQAVQPEVVSADEMWSFVQKKKALLIPMPGVKRLLAWVKLGQ